MNLDYYHNKTVLITGAGGFIGSVLARSLNSIKCKLVLHAHATQPVLESGRADVSVRLGDLTSPNEWQEILPEVDVVFHLAEHHYKTFDPEKDLAITAKPVLDLLQVLKNSSPQTKIVFASSSNLAGITDKLPVSEDSPDNPLTIYAIHKSLAEKYLQYYAREFGIKSTTVRLANVYGPATDRKTAKRAVLNYIISQALETAEVKLFSNKDCIRDFVYITDTVNALLAAGKINGKGEYYVIGSGQGKTLKEIIELVANEVGVRKGKDIKIVIDDKTEITEVEKRNFVADFSRFKNQTGWEPQVMLKQGIRETINYFLNQ